MNLWQKLCTFVALVMLMGVPVVSFESTHPEKETEEDTATQIDHTQIENSQILIDLKASIESAGDLKLKQQYVDLALPLAERYPDWSGIWIDIANYACDLDHKEIGQKAANQLLLLYDKHPQDFKLAEALTRLERKRWIAFRPKPRRSMNGTASPFTMRSRSQSWTKQLDLYKQSQGMP
ncbi:MAG: hypothetical protein SFT81_06920 [Candidatus Caenarcaniphilales bacterium]|nr:hypothetical protein [Candidatus Caenarcaniphilales bacterium]